MNWLDLLLAALVLWSVVTAFRKGISRELIGFATVIAAIIAGAWFYGSVGYYLLPYLKTRALANLAGFLAVFCGVILVGSGIGQFAKRMMKTVGLGFFDRVMGAVFGFARGLLISIALVMAIMAFAPGDKPPRSVVNSRLAPYVMDAARVCSAIAPHELRDGFQKSYGEIRNVWGNTLRKGIRALPSQNKEKNERDI
ncbi:MAG: CvpA family protein [Bryobacteraceae bacterium]